MSQQGQQKLQVCSRYVGRNKKVSMYLHTKHIMYQVSSRPRRPARLGCSGIPFYLWNTLTDKSVFWSGFQLYNSPKIITCRYINKTHIPHFQQNHSAKQEGQNENVYGLKSSRIMVSSRCPSSLSVGQALALTRQAEARSKKITPLLLPTNSSDSLFSPSSSQRHYVSGNHTEASFKLGLTSLLRKKNIQKHSL